MPEKSTKITDAKVQLKDGKMHYQSLGKGSPVLLLHSMSSSVWSWSKVMEPMAKEHTVYAVDTMGQGDSDKPPRDYSLEDYGNSFVEFMKVIGIKKASLIGNSVGAVFAIQIAATHPEMVDKVVLVGSPCRENEQERKEAMAMSRARYDANGLPLPRTMEDLKQTYANPTEEILKKTSEDSKKSGAWSFKCMTAMNNYDVVPALKKIKAKTLIVFGEKDMLRSKENALKANIKDSVLAIIPKAGHLPQIDNPKVFMEVVGPFLS